MNTRIIPLALGLCALSLAVATTTVRADTHEHDKHGDAADADNTKRNVEDRDDDTLTPLDQGGSEADRGITQAIRQAVVAHDDLSINAKNVKIITREGVVTLRGPVKSSDEKQIIAKIAAKAAGAKSVDNQLEVESN